MKNIFYRQRFLESPTLIFFIASAITVSFSGYFVIDFIAVIWLTSLFIGFNLIFNKLMPLVPAALRYPLIAMISVTVMSISYQVVVAILPSIPAIYHLLLALFSAIAIVTAYVDSLFYHSSLTSNISTTLSITTFLIVFLTLTIFLQYLISGSLIASNNDHHHQLPFWLTLMGRFMLLSLLLVLLKRLFRREQ